MLKTKHQHLFRRWGMTLYCKCGFNHDIVCAHRWGIPDKYEVSMDKMGGKVSQVQTKSICKTCGAVLSYNETTGSGHIIR